MIGVQVGHSQVHRIAGTYGAALEKTIATSRTLPPLQAKEALYVEVGGSMIFNRDEPWKEVKAGWVFLANLQAVLSLYAQPYDITASGGVL